jgi:hypothetical protein
MLQLCKYRAGLSARGWIELYRAPSDHQLAVIVMMN